MVSAAALVLALLCLSNMQQWVYGAPFNVTEITTTRLSRATEGGRACPNGCGSGGVCIRKAGHSPSGVCSCFPGFSGHDCGLRLCPSGNAWTGAPSANQVGHSSNTECSNMGYCDRNSGVCRCRPGFDGPACELLLCPMGKGNKGTDKGSDVHGQRRQCAGHGRCITNREAHLRQDFRQFLEKSLYDEWDGEMFQSCACDPGWEGLTCERRSCPKGDDPDTTGVDHSVLLECTCTTCNGGFTFSYRGETTLQIPYDASDDLLAYRLMELTSLEKVTARLSIGGTKLCDGDGALTRITIIFPQGDISQLTMDTYGTLAGTINLKSNGAYSMLDPAQESVKGTREFSECSNRGECDYDMGICKCIPGFMSSDGRGGFGDRGDCGYRYTASYDYTTRIALYNTTEDAIPEVYFSINDENVQGETGTTSCPFVKDVGICSNHGKCETNSKTCDCHDGWTGVLCNQKTCKETAKWVGETGPIHSRTAECGNVGTCDVATGKCVDCGGTYGVFAGEGCAYLACPDCNGQGTCLNMYELATFAYDADKKLANYMYDTPWDSFTIFGCSCDRAPSVDGLFHPDFEQYLRENSMSSDVSGHASKSKYYRGPYAHAVSNFDGYTCEEKRCPTGDDPTTRDDHDEIQKIACTADAGTFSLKFRGNSSMPINFNEKASLLELRLEQLYTVSSVSVEYSSATDALCSSDNSNFALITFQSEFGDLPLLEYTNINLVHSSAVTFDITEHRKGTKEDIECSGQGMCNAGVGICQCREGFSSSDGSLYAGGDRGDCAYINKFGV